MMPEKLLKHMLGGIAGASALLCTALTAKFGDSICTAMATKSNTRLLLIALELAILCAVYFALRFWIAASKNPRRWARWVEKGGFWQSTTGKTKFCGKCMNENNRRELKFNPDNTWECLSCGTRFSPHEPQK
jgi:hypothetical protein